jgi:diacylglycerol O-acyltransferase
MLGLVLTVTALARPDRLLRRRRMRDRPTSRKPWPDRWRRGSFICLTSVPVTFAARGLSAVLDPPRESRVVAERLSSLDLSFLCLEGANTPMHLGAVLIFAARATANDHGPADRLAAVLRRRVAAVPRLRRRLTASAFPPAAAAWVEDSSFDPSDHVYTSTLTAPGGASELLSWAADLLARPLDRSRPLWEMHVADGLADGRIAVLVKIHHALADGLRAVLLGMAVFDNPRPPRDHHSLVAEPPDAGVVSGLRSTANALVESGRRLIDPRTSADRVLHGARQARSVAAITGSLTHRLFRPAPRSPLNVPVGPHRRFAMLRLDLDSIHVVRKTHGATVNDVLLAVVAGGLRGWLATRGDAVPGPLRALVPVSRPHPDLGDTCGNRLSGYLLDLPIEEPDPLARLSAVRDAMRANKAAGPNRGAGAFPTLVNYLPSIVPRLAGPLAAPSSARLFNTVITQVPLPNLDLTLAGARLAEVYPVVPLAAGQALGIAVTTYGATAHIGLHADSDALPDVDHLAADLMDALADLLDAVPLDRS